MSCHHGQYVVRKVRRVGVMQAYPLHAFYLSHPVDQLRQPVFPVDIRAVRRQILRYHVELFHALADQPSHLVQYLVHRSRGVSAGDERYSAVRAEAVASLADLHVGIVWRCGYRPLVGEAYSQPLPKGKGGRLCEAGNQIIIIKLPVPPVHLGYLCCELLHVPLAKAAHDVQLAQLAMFLALCHL